MTQANILDKYRIEPRAKGYRNYSTSCWLVVIDKSTGKKLKDPRFPRSDLTFYSTDGVYEYLKKLKED